MKKVQLEKEDVINLKVCKTFNVLKVIESRILSRIYMYIILYSYVISSHFEPFTSLISLSNIAGYTNQVNSSGKSLPANAWKSSSCRDT